MRIALPLILSLTCLCLSACGQKGPLFMPGPGDDNPPKSQPLAPAKPAQ